MELELPGHSPEQSLLSTEPLDGKNGVLKIVIPPNGDPQSPVINPPTLAWRFSHSQV